jgi:uncharacterized protein (TIGR03437 family)
MLTPQAVIVECARDDMKAARNIPGALFLTLLITASSAQGQNVTVIVNFNGANGYNPNGLIQASDGYFYGTTQGGGASGNGTVFKVSPSGILTSVYSFSGTDGATPKAGLVQGSDGNFYGTTSEGGSNGLGTVFKITSAGTLTTLHGFSGTDGSTPVAALVQATDGNFYGTTSNKGTGVPNAPSEGTFFRITSGGTLTNLFDFDYSQGGAEPEAALVQASDGNFYGTTYTGTGPCPGGSIFGISASGSGLGVDGDVNFLCYLHDFNGVHPTAALLQATDGNLYGTASGGGTSGSGVVFRMPISGSPWTTLHSFNGSDGAAPNSGLVQTSDGSFYGTTSGGGANGQGVVFQITSAGALTLLYSFAGADGTGPKSALVRGSGGNFYGTTSQGGAGGGGTVFVFTPQTPASAPSISPGGIVPVYSTAATIQPGEWVSIFGSNLASGNATWNGDFPTTLGGTRVTINGKSAYLWFVSPGQINLLAPDDTATGTIPVVVTTAGGASTSTVNLGAFAPSFSLLDDKHVTGIILRSNGSGAYGGGSYDIIGPTGTSLGYGTVAAKAGDTIELFGVGFGPTTPAVPAGQTFSGSARTTNSVQLIINNISVTPTFTGLSSAGLYQINLRVPSSLGTGDVSLLAIVGGAQTPSSVVISLQ